MLSTRVKRFGMLICGLVVMCCSLTAADSLPTLVTRSQELRAELSKGVDAREVERADALLSQFIEHVRSKPAESCPEIRALITTVYSSVLKEDAAYPSATWDNTLRLLRRIPQDQLWADVNGSPEKEKSDKEQNEFYGKVASWILGLRKQVDGQPITSVAPPKVPSSYKNGFNAMPDPSEIPDEKERAEYAKEFKLYHARINNNVKQQALPRTIERAEDLLARELLSSRNPSLKSEDAFMRIMKASGASEERIRTLRRDHAAQN